MPIAFLLAMQAAGMVVDYIGNNEQIAMGRLGTKIQQAGIQANIDASRAQAADESVEAMKNLRQTIGSQIAIQAAKGTSSAQGSSATIRADSVNAFNNDERARRMNLLGREAGLRANMVLTGMHQLTSETQLGQAMTRRFFDNMGTTAYLAGSDSKKTPGKVKPTGGSGSSAGFGLTNV